MATKVLLFETMLSCKFQRIPIRLLHVFIFHGGCFISLSPPSLSHVLHLRCMGTHSLTLVTRHHKSGSFSVLTSKRRHTDVVATSERRISIGTTSLGCGPYEIAGPAESVLDTGPVKT